MNRFLLLLFPLIPLFLSAQSKEIDSLKNLLSKAKEDTNKVNLYLNLISKFNLVGEYKSQKKYATEALALSLKIKWMRGEAAAFRSLGSYYYNIGDPTKALNNFKASLQLSKKTNSKKGIASTYHNMAMVYQEQGDIPKTLEYYHLSLKIREQINDQDGIAECLGNIGITYTEQGKYAKALEYLERSFQLSEKIGKKGTAAYCLGNMGIISSEKGDYEKALYYYERCLKISEEMGDIPSIGMSLNNIGLAYRDQKNYSKSLEYTFQSLQLKEEMGDKWGISLCYLNIGETYFLQSENKKALEYAKKSLELAKELDFLQTISNAADLISRIYRKQGKGMEALEMYELSIQMRDSIMDEEAQEATIQKDMQYTFDKKQLADSLEVVEERKLNAIELKQEQTQRYFLYGGLLLLLVFAAFIYNRFQVAQKQKKEIEHHKHLVEEKNREITDSINYAKRLQEAILPAPSFVNSFVPNNFILYKPKDIVAGDFYWAEYHQDKFFIAAADSTGHGVPGAMVSVVCSNALNRAVMEFNLTDPGKILDKTRDLVIETFDKSNENVKDGMDISLLCIDQITKEITWAGANNALWYFQNGEIKEIKANKQSIGKSENANSFTTHVIESIPESTFYLFTDGYADQFGGPKGKKFKYRPFQELLISVQSNPLKDQQIKLDETIELWRGNIEQVDDICIVAVQI
jgi:tetratricopeptide (TPR) repeat protein